MAPNPAWPSTFLPQQYAAPLAVSPQVWDPAGISEVKLMFPDTRIGTALLADCTPLPS
jgi:hypothetical protein